MKKLYIASGFNSLANKRLLHVFDSLDKAKRFTDGLTTPQLEVMQYRTKNQLITDLLGGLL